MCLKRPNPTGCSEADVISFGTIIGLLCKSGREVSGYAVVPCISNTYVERCTPVDGENGGAGYSSHVHTTFVYFLIVVVFPLQANAPVYNPLLNAFGRKRDWKMFEQLLDQMDRSDVKLNTTSYNIILDVLGKAGRVDDVKKWFTRQLDFHQSLLRLVV